MTARGYKKEADDKSKAALSRETIRMDIEDKLAQIPDTGSRGVKSAMCGDIRVLLSKLVESYERT